MSENDSVKIDQIGGNMTENCKEIGLKKPDPGVVEETVTEHLGADGAVIKRVTVRRYSIGPISEQRIEEEEQEAQYWDNLKQKIYEERAKSFYKPFRWGIYRNWTDPFIRWEW